MFTLTALLSAFAAIFYAIRTGDLLDRIGPWERVGRLGIFLVMLTLTFALLARGFAHDPFLPYHWFVFAAFVVTNIGNVGMWVSGQFRAR